MQNIALLIYASSSSSPPPPDYYYYEDYYNHTDTQDHASQLPVQHNHGTEGTEHNSTEELQTGVNIPLRMDSTKVAEGGEEENFVQNSQVIELFGVLPISKSGVY